MVVIIYDTYECCHCCLKILSLNLKIYESNVVMINCSGQWKELYKMNIQESNSRLLITSGDSLILFDFNSRKNQSVKVPPPELPPNLTKGQMEVLNKQDRTINSLSVSRDGQYIAVSTENKQVIIYDRELNIKKNFIVNRTTSKLVFSNTGDILVADRTGDVFLYKFNDEKNEPVLLLGHLSMILDVALSECGKYIVTCDRDEKIRVSHFPNTYNIISYCLGHEEFVTTVKIVQNILISASGDGTVRLWNYLKGEQLNVINTNQHVNNADLLEHFSKEMDKEKVDVTALPITDMQICSHSDCLFVAVSLFNYNGIQIYKVKTDTHEWSHHQTIQPVEIPHKFYLSSNLYIFNNNKLISYKYVNCSYQIDPCTQMEDFYKKFDYILKLTDNNFITVLYKRKFDNVQEYLERKKLRLETSK
jgi:tRNA (guanine-N(7)-)-methyltransferase subunit TRM82